MATSHFVILWVHKWMANTTKIINKLSHTTFQATNSTLKVSPVRKAFDMMDCGGAHYDLRS